MVKAQWEIALCFIRRQGQTVDHVAIKLRTGSSVGTLCISRYRCSVPAGIARFAKIRCEPGTRAVGCLSARPRRCRGFNSRNGRRSSSKELPGGVHPANNAYPRIGRAGPGLAGPGNRHLGYLPANKPSVTPRGAPGVKPQVRDRLRQPHDHPDFSNLD